MPVCDECGVDFKHKSSLGRHLVEKHQAPKKTRNSSLTCPACKSVTPEQVAVVKQSFDPIVKNAPAIGKIFFKRLFELYPSSQKYFKHLGSTEEELFTNPIFQSHCTKVILSVGSLIDNLHADNHAKNEELAKKLATIHAKRKVTVEQSPYIKHTLMDILHLEPHSTLEKAWVNVIDALFSVYNEKLETAWKSKP